MMTPLVSILIPAYNCEGSLGETLRSAIAQTWENKEIIVVDDGSTDQTLAVARRFESEGVQVATKKNEGAAATRNAAYSLCKGDYIQWLDADDLISPDKIARQVEALGQCRSKRTLLSSGWAWFMYRPSKAKFVPTELWRDLSTTDWLIQKMTHNLHMQTATWLVSRELCEDAGPWNTKLLGDDDGEYFCRVLLASDGVHFVPDCKVYYRLSGAGSLSYVGLSEKKMVAQWHSMELHIGYLLSLENSERTRLACVTFLQNWLMFFYPDSPALVEKAREKAVELGGHLNDPQLSWKYDWIRILFGWRTAKKWKLQAQGFRLNVERSWDKWMYEIHGRDSQGNQGQEKEIRLISDARV
jgi:glycosyltransferase involved in cell wall biosynthesis